MRKTFKAVLCALLAISMTMQQIPYAMAQAGEDGLILSVSASGPDGGAFSVQINPGMNASGQFSAGGTVLLDDVQIGMPETLSGTLKLPIYYGNSSRGTATLNFLWDRFAGSILFSGNLSPYAVLDVVANDVSTQIRATEGGSLPANSNVTPGDFHTQASLVTIRIINTTRAGNGERVNADPVSISLGMGLPPLSMDGGAAAAGGGSGNGKGFKIGFALAALFGGLAAKIGQTFVNSMQKMAQQEMTTRISTLAIDATLEDAEEAAADALLIQELNARVARELVPEEQVAIGACSITNMSDAEEAARTTERVLADANQRQDVLESDARNVCARVPADTMSDEMRRICNVPAPRGAAGETQNTLNADQYVTQTRDVSADATPDSETNQEKALRQFLDLLTDSHRPLTATANINATDINNSQYTKLLEGRSLEAQQSLIKTTFHRMFADRTSGATESRETLAEILQKQNYDAATINKLIGDKPSYWSQREIMGKLRYQDPRFYVELEGKSESQLRAVHASIEAQKSMVWRDLYTSVRQRELLLAQILEMKLRAQGEAVSSQLSSVGD